MNPRPEKGHAHCRRPPHSVAGKMTANAALDPQTLKRGIFDVNVFFRDQYACQLQSARLVQV